LQSPSYTYGFGGTYIVTLTVTYSGSPTRIVSHDVTVSASTAPSITYKSCSGATCTFTATGSAPFTWAGVDATSVDTATATRTYTAQGDYPVTVTDINGSSASTSVSCVLTGHGHNTTLSCS